MITRLCEPVKLAFVVQYVLQNSWPHGTRVWTHDSKIFANDLLDLIVALLRSKGPQVCVPRQAKGAALCPHAYRLVEKQEIIVHALASSLSLGPLTRIIIWFEWNCFRDVLANLVHLDSSRLCQNISVCVDHSRNRHNTKRLSPPPTIWVF